MEPDQPSTPAETGVAPGEESSTGLDPKIAGLLSYLLGFLSGIIFLVIERKSSYVRFHAMQSTLTFVALFVIQIVAGFVPLIGGLIYLVAVLATFVVWIVLMVKAFQGERYQLPIVGEVAEERAQLPG